MAVGQPNESLNQMTCKPPQIVSSIAMESHRGDFGATGKWSGRPPEACMQNGEGIGALRTLTLANGQQIIDRLEGQSPMSYTYSIVSSPRPVASYTATMAVTSIDENAGAKQTCETAGEPIAAYRTLLFKRGLSATSNMSAVPMASRRYVNG